jgi:hypothetical protein
LSSFRKFIWSIVTPPTVGFENAAERGGTTIESLPSNHMNKLYPLVLKHHLPLLVRYCIAASIMLVCAASSKSAERRLASCDVGQRLQASPSRSWIAYSLK